MLVPSFYKSTFTQAGGALFTALLAVACVYDVRYRRLPNLVVAVTAACGVGYSVLVYGGRGVIESALGAALGLVLWLPFYALRWIGAGDVKLFTAAGAWLWPTRTFEAALLAAITGGLLSLLWMLHAYGVSGTGIDLSVALTAPRRDPRRPVTNGRRTIPYGIALAVGALGIGWLPDTIRSAVYATH